MQLHSLENSSRPFKRRRRVGRGIGSGVGKTCGRGVKGAGARSGWKSRARYEGGQIPLYRKLPERGFTRGKFLRRLDSINLDQVEKLFNNGDMVNIESLKRVGYLKGESHGVKLLGRGELTKKLSFEVAGVSTAADEKLKALGCSYTIV